MLKYAVTRVAGQEVGTLQVQLIPGDCEGTSVLTRISASQESELNINEE